MKMKAKDKFLKYCNMFRNDLADLQKEIDYEQEGKQWHGTLAYIGANYSYELANICFGLGYATWFFEIGEYIGEPFDYETLKQGVCDTIISNEKIENVYNAEEINKIKNEILNAKIN